MAKEINFSHFKTRSRRQVLLPVEIVQVAADLLQVGDVIGPDVHGVGRVDPRHPDFPDVFLKNDCLRGGTLGGLAVGQELRLKKAQ